MTFGDNDYKEAGVAVRELHRLSSDAYGQLSKQCPVIAVNNDTQQLQAGFQLGVQHVLQKLREGFVVRL